MAASHSIKTEKKFMDIQKCLPSFTTILALSIWSKYPDTFRILFGYYLRKTSDLKFRLNVGYYLDSSWIVPDT